MEICLEQQPWLYAKENDLILNVLQVTITYMKTLIWKEVNTILLILQKQVVVGINTDDWIYNMVFI